MTTTNDGSVAQRQIYLYYMLYYVLYIYIWPSNKCIILYMLSSDNGRWRNFISIPWNARKRWSWAHTFTITFSPEICHRVRIWYGSPQHMHSSTILVSMSKCVVCVRGALPPLFFAFHFRRGCDTHTRLSIQHIFSCFFFFWFSLVRSPTTTLSGDVFSQPNSVWSFGRFGMNKRERAHEAQKA